MYEISNFKGHPIIMITEADGDRNISLSYGKKKVGVILKNIEALSKFFNGELTESSPQISENDL